jgi:hypothetical protein
MREKVMRGGLLFAERDDVWVWFVWRGIGE